MLTLQDNALKSDYANITNVPGFGYSNLTSVATVNVTDFGVNRTQANSLALNLSNGQRFLLTLQDNALLSDWLNITNKPTLTIHNITGFGLLTTNGNTIQLNTTSTSYQASVGNSSITIDAANITSGTVSAARLPANSFMSQYNVSNSSVNVSITNNTNIIITGNSTVQVNLTGTTFSIAPTASMAGRGMSINNGVLEAAPSELRSYLIMGDRNGITAGAGTLLMSAAAWGNRTIIGSVFTVGQNQVLNVTNMTVVVTTAGTAPCGVNFGLYNCTGSGSTPNTRCTTTQLIWNSSNFTGATVQALNITNHTVNMLGQGTYIFAITGAYRATAPTLRATAAITGGQWDNNTIFKLGAAGSDTLPGTLESVSTVRSPTTQVPLALLWSS
jgi:CheY-specific phosphatase CheX